MASLNRHVLTLSGLVALAITLLGCESPTVSVKPDGPYRIGSYMTDHIRKGDQWEYSYTSEATLGGRIFKTDTAQIVLRVLGWNGDSTQLTLTGGITGITWTFWEEKNTWESSATDTTFRLLVTSANKSENMVKVTSQPEGGLPFFQAFYGILFMAEKYLDSSFRSPSTLSIGGSLTPIYRGLAHSEQPFGIAEYLAQPPVAAYAIYGRTHSFGTLYSVLRMETFNGEPVSIEIPPAAPDSSR